MNPLTLYELNNIVRCVLEETIPEAYWVQAELSEVNERHGHCFLEFVQKGKSGDGTLIAKARGQIWRERWAMISHYFSRTTGEHLREGMQVLVKVDITFHELYGYSLNVIDIDPTYTMGDIARRRKEILQQLKEEGVENMNKELSLPVLMKRIAVISSPTAAGFGDFQNQLQNNPYGLAFYTKLFPAIMQGENVENSIIAALESIAQEEERWDVVVIIRGGGGASDLSGFDTLRLAENVAQFPLPIITGIGHERDDTVIDMISHTRVKTPTAAAEFIIRHGAEQLNHIEDMCSRLLSGTDKILSLEKLNLQIATQKLPTLTSAFCSKEKNRIEHLGMAAGTNIYSRLATLKGKTDLANQRISSAAHIALRRMESRLETLTAQIEAADPARILKLGYSITRIGGKAVRSSRLLNTGDIIETTLADGNITSTVVSNSTKGKKQ